MRCFKLSRVTTILLAMLPSMIYSGWSEARDASQIELSRLLELFMFPTNASYNILPWQTGSSAGTPIEWNHAGIVECAPWIEKKLHQAFCRSGSVVITVKGKITHTVLGKQVQAGRWKIDLMGPRAGASLVEIESDVNSQELGPELLTNALKGNKENGLSLKSIKSCEEEQSEIFIVSGARFRPLSVKESWSCGSAGCSIQFLLAADDASSVNTCS